MMGANSLAHNKLTFVTVPGLLKRGKKFQQGALSISMFIDKKKKIRLNHCPMLYIKVITGAVDMAYYLERPSSHNVTCSIWAR